MTEHLSPPVRFVLLHGKTSADTLNRAVEPFLRKRSCHFFTASKRIFKNSPKKVKIKQIPKGSVTVVTRI